MPAAPAAPTAPAVPAHHAQAVASTALQTWPMTVGLTVEYLAHHDQGPRGAVTFAVVRATAPWPGPALIRCDGYGHVARACEHPRPDNQPCWHPSADHLSLRDPGLCTTHLPPLAVGDWVRHPGQPFYGRVTSTEQDGAVGVDFGEGEVAIRATHVPRIPPHVAAELARGPLSEPVPAVIDE